MLAEFLRRMAEARVATLPEGEREAVFAQCISDWTAAAERWQRNVPPLPIMHSEMTKPPAPTLPANDPRVHLFMAHCFAEHLAGHAGASYTEALSAFGALDAEIQQVVHTADGWKLLAKLLTRPGTPPLPVTIH